nr:hypothetical protein [Tanacetum cinerariifolium]
PENLVNSLQSYGRNGEVTSSKPTNLSEAVRMTHKLMEQKLHENKERDIEGNKRKWENFQCGNSSKGSYKDNSCHQQNNQKQGTVQAMTTASSEGNVYLDNSRCVTVALFIILVVVKSNAPIWTCYDYGEQGDIRNHCPKKNKPQGRNASGRSYVIKDADKQGPNVVTGTFLLNNRYASVLFNSSFDKSYVNTIFSHLIDINPDKLDVSYEVELADGKVISINMTLIVEGDKGPSRLKVIFCINARKYIERCCQMLAAHVTRKKSKEKYLEDVLVIRDFHEVFLDDFSGLPLPRQVEFRIDLVPRAALLHAQHKEEHKEHLKIILELLKKEQLYTKFSKYDFWLDSVQFLAHVIDNKGVHVDPAKIEALRLTGKEEEEAFQILKQKLYSAPILALPEGTEDFKVHKENYTTYDLELGAVVFALRLLRTSSGYDLIWVIVDQLTKSAHFLPIKKMDSIEKLTQLYLKEVVCRHGVLISIILDRDIHFKSRFWRSLQTTLGMNLDTSTAYHPQTGVIRFGKRGRLSPRYIRPFKILAGVGPVAYMLELPKELQGIHSTFHVSNLKKCLADENLIIPLDEVQLNDKVHFIEEPMEIVDREVKRLKQSQIPIVKVRWNSRRGPKFTWECED